MDALSDSLSCAELLAIGGAAATLFLLYCMLIARSAGKGSQRVAAAVIPRSRTPQSNAGALRAYRTIATRQSLESPAMLRGAVQKHEQAKESILSKTFSQSLFPSSPSSQQASQKQGRKSVTAGSSNVLKPASQSALNEARGAPQRNGAISGTKRTASGLAKALDGAFEDDPGSQYKPVVVKGGHTEILDENDFDSDVDLDFEEPKTKSTVSYPKLPPQQKSFAAPPKPVLYPTLPRQQQHQPSSYQNSGYGEGHPAVTEPPRSSAALSWSSSPADHYCPSLSPSASRTFTYTKNDGPPQQAAQNGPLPPTTKRRTLPWLEDDARLQSNLSTTYASTTASKVVSSSVASAAPAPKDSRKSMYPWNTTASAVKEQQKRHREEIRKIKKVDGDEESLTKAKSKRQKVARVFLSEEQQHVLDLVVEQKKSVFFTGSAGTGKSVLMREIISSLRKRYAREPDRVAVTASTGLAACNVGGVTLHSFAGIGLGKEDVPELVRKIKKNQKARHRWMRTKVLVIDEVSMVDGELFDKLESIARSMRNNGRPFGGIQLVITGDFFQLPPVPDFNKVAKFAFDAATWNTTVEWTIGLHHVFRQKDPVFAGMLNEMREGRLTEPSIRAFRSLSRPLNFEDQLEATELFPLRTEVERANQERMHLLQGSAWVFEARDGGSIVDKVQRDRLLQNCMAPETITLKKGAQVMLIKNVDETLVNGSIGRVIGFMDETTFDKYQHDDSLFSGSQGGTLPTQDDVLSKEEQAKRRIQDNLATARKYPLVRFVIADGTSRDLLCQPEMWKVELPSGEVQASRQQVPLILAWALSIHKAQGQTLERVKVDLGKVFEKGQAYVALSRATSMAGLQVLRFDPKKVLAHEKVRTFYGNLARVELAEKGKKEERKRGGLKAEEYEKIFVEDEWQDMP